MNTTTDATRAASIAFTRVLSLLEGVDKEQEDAVAQYMEEHFGEPLDADGNEIRGLLEAETRLISLVRELQAQAVDAIAVIVGAAGAKTHARS